MGRFLINPSPRTLQTRNWRRREKKKLRLLRLRVQKNRFLDGFWSVAGHFFSVKSSLNPHALFSVMPITTEHLLKPIEGYVMYSRGSEINRKENRAKGIKNYQIGRRLGL